VIEVGFSEWDFTSQKTNCQFNGGEKGKRRTVTQKCKNQKIYAAVVYSVVSRQQTSK
jgi:hypothetical protein